MSKKILVIILIILPFSCLKKVGASSLLSFAENFIDKSLKSSPSNDDYNKMVEAHNKVAKSQKNLITSCEKFANLVDERTNFFLIWITILTMIEVFRFFRMFFRWIFRSSKKRKNISAKKID